MECLGPDTGAGLFARLGLPLEVIDGALAALEHTGVVLQGRFTPGGAAGEVEWCDRRLLARIHRLTLGRLRREIEPVPPAGFMRFLFRWQHLQTGTQLHGRAGLAEVISQLQGLELPAPAWEEQVLPGRVRSYHPDDLEHLCLSGQVAWGRLHTGREEPDALRPEPRRRRQTLTRQAPLSFVLREDLPAFVDPRGQDAARDLGRVAADVYAMLERRGASFLTEITRTLRLLPIQAEAALWELVARGLVSGGGGAGRDPRRRLGRGRRRRAVGAPGGGGSAAGGQGEGAGGGDRARPGAGSLNLAGILTPGSRIPATSGHLIVYRDGLPVASGPLGVVRSHLQPVA